MPILAGQTAVAISFNQGTYTPVLTAATTSPTLGPGSTQAGWWKRTDEMITGGAHIRFGTSGVVAGSGLYYISLPFAASTTFMLANDSTALGSTLGSAHLRDNSVPTGDVGICYLATAGNTAAIRVVAGQVTNANPWVWAASDALTINFAYQADPAGL